MPFDLVAWMMQLEVKEKRSASSDSDKQEDALSVIEVDLLHNAVRTYRHNKADSC